MQNSERQPQRDLRARDDVPSASSNDSHQHRALDVVHAEAVRAASGRIIGLLRTATHPRALRAARGARENSEAEGDERSSTAAVTAVPTWPTATTTPPVTREASVLTEDAGGTRDRRQGRADTGDR